MADKTKDDDLITKNDIYSNVQFIYFIDCCRTIYDEFDLNNTVPHLTQNHDLSKTPEG